MSLILWILPQRRRTHSPEVNSLCRPVSALRNPRAKLLPGEVWESMRRPQVCRTLNLQPTAAPELAQLKQQLDTAYGKTSYFL